MSWRQLENRWDDGDLTTPHEINAELRHHAAEVNGFIDRDNVGTDQVTTAKQATGTCSVLHAYDEATNIDIDKAASTDGESWQEIDGSPTSLVANLTTPDCALVVKLTIDYDFTQLSGATPSHCGVAIGVKVDGRIYGNDGERAGDDHSFHQSIAIAVPVRAGTHRIVPVLRFPRAQIANGYRVTTTDVRMHVREMIR